MEPNPVKLKKSPQIPHKPKLSIPEHTPLQPPPPTNTSTSINTSTNIRTNTNNTTGRSSNNPWIQKPLSVYQSCRDNSETHKEHGIPPTLHYGTTLQSNPTHYLDQTELERHMSLFDLTSLGIGGTIGSGIFVLCSVIAHTYAGPATFVSWSIAGLAALMSGCCYAELSSHMPSAGSAYVYVYASMGELPAVIVAGCLTLEYVVSSSAVARSWGEKVVDWMRMELGLSDYVWLENMTHAAFNPMACLIASLSVTLLLMGVKESKAVTNLFTVTKVGVVLFMTIGGLLLFQPSNLTPIIPPQFGWAGIFRGATSSFFGYIGFDEICCLAGEAQMPKKNIPYSILLTLGFSTFIYIMASFALTGMQPYQEMDGISGFPGAFTYNGHAWAAQLTAAGEILTLPIVVLITIMAQPRLQYALAQDGLLPSWFAQFDSSGNLWNGTFSAGIVMILIASFVPFTHLNDMISAGVLISFCMTSSALLLLRHDSPKMVLRNWHGSSNNNNTHVDSFLMEKLVAMFNAISFLASILLTHLYDYPLAEAVAYLLLVSLILCCAAMKYYCPPSKIFGGDKRRQRPPRNTATPMTPEQDLPEIEDEEGYFKTPFLPILPCVAIFINWYLISQLEALGIIFLLVFLGACALFYFAYSAKHSLLRKSRYLEEMEVPEESHLRYLNDQELEDDWDEDGRFHGTTEKSDLLLFRSISLPRRG